MAKRKTLSARARFEILKRDLFTCQYCGAHPPSAILHVDHIVPVAGGGSNDSSNLVTACSICNGGKGARSLTTVPKSLADRAAEIKEREAQLRGYYKIIEASRGRAEDEAWRVARPFMDQFSRDGSLSRDWFSSIKNFVAKLGVYDCMDAMELAIAKQPNSQNHCFRYFCGICWNKVREAAQ